MSLNTILLWLVFAFSSFSLIQLTLTRRREGRIWILKNAFVLGLSLLLLKLLPLWAGFIGAGFWSVLILIPLLGTRAVNNLSLRELYTLARLVCVVCYRLHPDRGFKVNVILLQSRIWAKQGKTQQAIDYLRGHRDKTGTLYGMATVYLYLFGRQWDELLLWLKGIQMNMVLLTFYCRALGEAGELRLLAEVPFRYQSLFERLHYYSKNMIRLYIFAFHGETEQVEKLFKGALSGVSRGQKRYWSAVALQAAGKYGEASRILEELAKSKNHILRETAAGRIGIAAGGSPAENETETAVLKDKNAAALRGRDAAATATIPGNADPTAAAYAKEDTAELIRRTADDFTKEERYSLFKRVQRRGAVVTLALIVINAVIFIFEEILGGSTNEVTLYSMGALFTLGVGLSDSWRLVSAQFLHYGILHLSMNMLGLYILGPHVEKVMGSLRYAFIYLVSGTAALTCYLFIAVYTNAHDFLVGASAGIMGIVGALLAVLLKGYLGYHIKII
ncbi:MAG: rhomboid family intramembrane serine protease, partial [Spirochaetia bacterium]